MHACIYDCTVELKRRAIVDFMYTGFPYRNFSWEVGQNLSQITNRYTTFGYEYEPMYHTPYHSIRLA